MEVELGTTNVAMGGGRGSSHGQTAGDLTQGSVLEGKRRKGGGFWPSLGA